MEVEIGTKFILPKSIYSISKPGVCYGREGEIVTLDKIDDRWWIMEKSDGDKFSTDRTTFMSDIKQDIKTRSDSPVPLETFKESSRKKSKTDSQNQQSLF